MGVVMGSDSDLPVMTQAAEVLDSFKIPFEMTVASAHRSPERSANYAALAASRGLKVIIAGAGMAAHLAGVMAALTTIPVIGVPMAGGPLQGIDALLSTIQMPPGVPVATVGVGAAKNAGLLAIQILALSDPALADALACYKAELSTGVEKKAANLKESLSKFSSLVSD